MKLPFKRHIIIGIILGLVLALGLQVSQSGLLAQWGSARSATPAPSSGYGFATALLHLPAAERDRQLSDMKAMGASWVRYDLGWDTVQPNSAKTYDWSTYDEITRAATARGLKVLMILDFAPTWATKANCPEAGICPPKDAAAYGRFAAEAVKHYEPYGVKHWEIWNEPNISFRFQPSADAKHYTRMLKAAYKAIKRVDPEAVVIAAATSPSGTDDTNYSPADFVRALYAHGAKGSFDALSAHPYTAPLSPLQSHASDAWGQLLEVHELMTGHGDGAKQLWITEYGAATNGPDKPGDHVTEAFQAQLATEAIGLLRTYPWVGPVLWYDYIDASTATDTNENFYGLVRSDGTHKPSYDAWVQAVITK